MPITSRREEIDHKYVIEGPRDGRVVQRQRIKKPEEKLQLPDNKLPESLFSRSPYVQKPVKMLSDD